MAEIAYDINIERSLTQEVTSCPILKHFCCFAQNLLSVLMTGLPDTPYEGGLFQFELCLPETYPKTLPAIAYVEHELTSAKVNLGLPEGGIFDLENLFEGRTDLDLTKILSCVRGTYPLHMHYLHLLFLIRSGSESLIPINCFQRRYWVWRTTGSKGLQQLHIQDTFVI